MKRFGFFKGFFVHRLEEALTGGEIISDDLHELSCSMELTEASLWVRQLMGHDEALVNSITLLEML
jgi:hypothetical protein